jgi:Protein of unknown function (DUF3180)
VRPVRRRDLVVLAVGLAVATWLLVRAWYGELPPLRWWLPTPLGVLAVAEALGARTLRARLRAERAARRTARGGQDDGPVARTAAQPAGPVRPVEPLLVARLAVLAQASAYVGAVFAGIWGGVLAYVGPELGRLQSARGDTVTALLGLACSVGLVAAALWLESVCRVPPGSRDDDPHLAPSA